MSNATRKKSTRAGRATLSPHHIQTREYRQMDLLTAHQLLPMVRKITKSAEKQLAPIQVRLNNMVPADPRNEAVNREYEKVVQSWAGKIERLGLKVHGLWQVGFDGGMGWFGWQYPARTIQYFIEYGDYFCDRQPLAESALASDADASVEHK